jgi:hypothetical protein
MAQKSKKPFVPAREPSGSGAGTSNSSSIGFLRKKTTFLIVALALFLLCTLLFAQTAAGEILYRLLTDGLLCLLWLTSAFGYGSFSFSLREKAGMRGLAVKENSVLRFVIATALGLGILSLLTLAAGSLKLAHPITGWLFILTGIALAAIFLYKDRYHFGSPLSTQHSALSTYLYLLVIPLASLTLVAAFVPPGILWGDEPNGYDVLEYHLELPREWHQTHSTAPTTNNVFSHFPLLVESHYLLAMQLKGGPWSGMYLAQLMHFSFFVLTVLAIYAFARSGEGGPRSAILPTLLIATSPWIPLLAPIAYNEGGLILFGTLALIYALRALQGDNATHNLILAGVFTGFACGSKLTAVPTLLIFIPLAVILSSAWHGRLAHAPLKKITFACILFTLAALITFSPWLLRTYLATHNPVFPELTSIFGPAHFSPDQITRWHTANHLPNALHRSLTGRLSEFIKQILLDWRYAYTLIPLALFAALSSLFAPSRFRAFAVSPRPLFLIIYLLLLTIFWLCFTHLQSRFYILAIPVTALLLTQLHLRWEFTIAAVLIAIQIAFSTSAMIHRFQQRISPLLPLGAIGMENMTQFLPEDISLAVATDKPIALVGDAKAFLYPIPIQRLHYRTVFDVQAKPGQSIVDAWLEGAPSDSIIIVDPVELARFSKTYHAIPPLPDDFPFPRDRMFILPPR